MPTVPAGSALTSVAGVVQWPLLSQGAVATTALGAVPMVTVTLPAPTEQVPERM